MNIPFPRNINFVGREDELQALHAALNQNGSVGINAAGLSGMGGVGKTQLAVEYAYRYEDDYPDGIFWISVSKSLCEGFADLGRTLHGLGGVTSWAGRLVHLLVEQFNVEDMRTLCLDLGVYDDEFTQTRTPMARDMVAYCQRHGLTGQLLGLLQQKRPSETWPDVPPSSPDATRSQDDWIAAVFAYLEEHPKALLVLDNLEEPLTLTQPLARDLVPIRLPGALLFTTRSRELGGFAPLRVDVLPEAAALDLLLSHPKRRAIREARNPQHETARQICAALGYLPLAVEVACKQLGQKPEMKLTAYQRTLQKQGALSVIESQRLPVETAHERGLAAVLVEQWERLLSVEAQTLLRVAAALPEAALIPTARLGLLAGIGDDEAEDFFDDTTLSEGLRQLVDASLTEQLRGGRVRLHPLVRAFAAAQAAPDLPLQGDEFHLWCASNLANAYEDFAVLKDNCAERGIDTLQEDVLTAIELIVNHQSSTLDERLWNLLRLLQRERHNLYGWNQQESPALFAQQMAYRAWDLGMERLTEAAERLADNLDYRLAPCWRVRNESLALERTLMGHTGSVNGVAVTPDGMRVVSASEDRTLKVWNLQTGAEEHTLIDSHWVNALAITPDGLWAVSGSENRMLKVWNLQTGAKKWTLTGHSGSINAVAITPDGRCAVSASNDGTLKVWNLQTGIEERTLICHLHWVTAVAITPDGERAVSASDDRTLKVWNLTTGTEERTLTGHSEKVNAVAITPDGERAVSASDDRALKVWDLTTGMEERTLTGHSYWVKDVAITPDGKWAVSASSDMKLKVWNLQTGTEEQTLTGHSSTVKAVAITQDGHRAVSASEDQTLKVWNLQTGIKERTPTGHSYAVNAMAITPDGSRAVSASIDKTLKIWDLQTGAEEQTLTGHSHWVTAVAITPDGRRAVSASHDKTLKVWNLQTGAEERSLIGHSYGVIAVAITPDGRRAVSASNNRELKVWNLQTGTEERALIGHLSDVDVMAITPNGRHAVLASNNSGTVKVWNLQTEAEEWMMSCYSPLVAAVAITPNNGQMVLALSDGKLKVWDMQTGAEKRTLIGHSEWVNDVAITPDGRHAISTSSDRTLKVWDLQTGKEIASIILGSSLECVAVAPDSVTIVTGDDAGSVYCLQMVESPTT